MTRKNRKADANTRLSIKRHVGPLCEKAALWSIRHSWFVRPHNPEFFEIDYVHRGEMTNVLSDGSRLSMHGGDVSILQPGERHCCEHGAVGPIDYVVFGIRPQPRLPCPPFTNREVRDILRTFRESGNRVVRACRETDAAFVAMREALALPRQEQQAAWYAPWVRSLTLKMLACIVRSLATPVQPPHFEAVKLARCLIEQDLTESPSMKQIASTAGVSPARLVQLFREQTGLTPTDYRMRLRLVESRRKLRDPAASVTSIAVELGFASSQHFASCFRKYFGLTPSAYRRSPEGSL